MAQYSWLNVSLTVTASGWDREDTHQQVASVVARVGDGRAEFAEMSIGMKPLFCEHVEEQLRMIFKQSISAWHNDDILSGGSEANDC